MEYQRKKKQILSNVEYTNLLGFALVENKLQKNFKSIVQALLLSQSDNSQMKDDLSALGRSFNKQIGIVNDRIYKIEKKLSEITGKQAKKQSLHILEDLEQNKCNELLQPQVNVNFIKSPKNSDNHIHTSHDLDKQRLQQLENQQKQMKDKLNILISSRIEPQELDKKISGIRENINLLKAELKVLGDRQSKSSRRLSLNQLEKIQGLMGQPRDNSEDKGDDMMKRINEEIQRQINGLHIQMNTMKLNLEQMKQAIGQQKRKQSKSSALTDELLKQQKKFEQRVQNSHDSFETQLKQIKSDLLNLQLKNQQDSQSSKKSRKNIETKQNISPNSNNQINDKISKLQAVIQGLVTESELKRYKSEVKDKFSILEAQVEQSKKEVKEQIQMLTQILDSKEQQISNILRTIEDIKLQIADGSSHCQRKNNICLSRCEQLKKNLQNLREDLEFYKTMNQTANEGKTNGLSQNYHSDEEKPKGQNSDKNSFQELKKYLNRKLHDQRTYLLGLIRDIQKKSNGGKSNVEQDLIKVWDKIEQINLYLGKKANDDDLKKSLSHFEKRLAAIYQRITSSNQNNEDARIAKTNWFCLSCDKNLQNYQGKVGQHVVWDSMPIKPGYAKYFSTSKQDKKSLPTLKR